MFHLPPSITAMGRLPTPRPLGIPSEQELVAAYCSARNVSPLDDGAWAYYLALSMFRAASILAGVYTRAQRGNAASARAADVGRPSVVRDLASAALQLLGNGSRAQGACMESADAAAALGSTDKAKPELMPETHALSPSQRCAALRAQLCAFMRRHIAPADGHFRAHAEGPERWTPFSDMERLKGAAKAAGLWNLWIPGDLAGRVNGLLASSRLQPAEASLLRCCALARPRTVASQSGFRGAHTGWLRLP